MSNRKLISILWISSLIILVMTLTSYIFHFSSCKISDNPQDWADFGSYFGGIVSAMISFLNLLILTYLSIRLVKNDDERNKWTLQELARPYGELVFNKSIWDLEILIENIGLGPMIVNKITIVDENGDSHNTFSDLLNPQPGDVEFNFHAFRFSNNHCAIGKDSKQTLFSLKGDCDNSRFEALSNKTIKILQNCFLEITYSDMYKKEIATIYEKIDFGVDY